MTARRHLPSELVIGVVGPYELVERIMLSGTAARDEMFGVVPGMWPPGQSRLAGDAGPAGPGVPTAPARVRQQLPGLAGSALPRRLIAAAYRREREAPEKLARLGAAIDVCLFASPVPYEYARRAGVIAVPATYVRLDGGALYAALLRASRDQGCDIERISVDVLSRSAVEEAYAELGIAADGVRLRDDPGSPAALASFHERLWRMGETSAAFTCLDSVTRRLVRAGVPVITVRPTDGAIRMAIWNAVLLGGHRRLEAEQLVLVVVEVPKLRDGARRALSRYARDELRLAVHRFLIQEAQRIQAVVSRADDHSFVVAATRGSLAAVTGDFTEPPFAERARAELGITIEVGVGMGRTAQEAEAHARSALIRSRSGGTSSVAAPGRDGHPLVPPPRQAAAPSARPVPSRGIETLARLAGRLDGSGAALVVDAETAGRLLGVTQRTARRLLRGLVDEGLAWPLPPSRGAQPGRPRQFYRLITEKLAEMEPSRTP
jgi:hypothetical protein